MLFTKRLSLAELVTSLSLSPPTEGVAGDSSVEVDSGGTMGGGGLSGDDDGRLDRREMKSEPGDAMADVYSESSEMSTDPQSHSGEGMEPRQPVMYPVVDAPRLAWQITHAIHAVTNHSLASILRSSVTRALQSQLPVTHTLKSCSRQSVTCLNYVVSSHSHTR